MDVLRATIALCVTGMHRSGTSLTASWLERCGLKLDDGQVYGATEGNPLGHFEDKEFVDLQAARILTLAPRSRGWIYTKGDGPDVDESFEEGARSLVEARNTKYAMWGWKDPRSVLFLEYWRKTIPGLKTILLWRPCAEVVSSLVTRSRRSDHADFKIGSMRAIKTWRAYNERVLAYKNDHPGDTVLVRLTDLLEHDRGAIDKINRRLGFTLAYRPISEVYEAKLLHAHDTSWVRRLASHHYGVASLEASLEQASDRLT